MEPLIDILSQLSEGEKNDFTSWFSELGKKDREESRKSCNLAL